MFEWRISAGRRFIGANLWHLSHFFTNLVASVIMYGQKYPAVRALWARLRPPEWLPHTPSWISSINFCASTGPMHRSMGPIVDFLYNCSPIIEYLAAFSLTVLASRGSVGRFPNVKYCVMGLIHPSSAALVANTWCAGVCGGSVMPPPSNKTSMLSSVPPINAFLASASALWFSSLGICSILKLAKRALAPITLEKYLCSLGSFTSKSPLT
ncbi:hypothetical protein PanWU01x14_263710 [Parasponia andersonii]|uniref:Uncharacterized protein n=1 Tax=Parasponia andersonii TaxID=3476 RepID=A0A2P5B7X0_PARAD|nr:hypothetical protein PanWU01x14_263710 [Parasponia andersonii]